MALLGADLGGNNSFGFDGLVVDYQGNLKISSRTDALIGNVLEHGLKNLFLSDKTLNALRARKIKKCGTCIHYSRCGGDRNAAFAATGSFLGEDPGCWLS